MAITLPNVPDKTLQKDPPPEETFSKYPSARWSVAGGVVVFPVEEVQESFRNRIVQHKRVYRDGARLDDTGSESIVWKITSGFYNSLDHEESVSGATLYPTVLNQLCDSFLKHETGELTTPTRGPRRCRAESYDRVERNDQRDFAALVFTFVEDNEDDASAAAFQAPSPASIVRATAAQADADAESLGVKVNLLELAASLEALANAPAEYVGDLEAQANAVSNRIESIERAFAERSVEAGTEVRNLLTNPAASRAGRLMRRLSDVGHRAIADKLALGPKIVPVTFRVPVSLFTVAARVGMPAEQVIQLNPGLDPFEVPPGTPIKVFDAA